MKWMIFKSSAYLNLGPFHTHSHSICALFHSFSVLVSILLLKAEISNVNGKFKSTLSIHILCTQCWLVVVCDNDALPETAMFQCYHNAVMLVICSYYRNNRTLSFICVLNVISVLYRRIVCVSKSSIHNLFN